jgi:hypothetical protein
MDNKKGISDVITTVLIILFGIVAVAVIGAVVLNQVNSAAKKIDSSSLCGTFEVEPVKCGFDDSNSNGVYEDGESQYATLRRGSGDEDITIQKITVIYEDSDGVTYPQSFPAPITPTAINWLVGVAGDTHKVAHNPTGTPTYVRAHIALDLMDGSGNTYECDYYDKKSVACVY